VGKFKMLVFSNPVAGQEQAYNDWYTGRHLADIVALPGFTAAQRLRIHSVPLGSCVDTYLAIYEMETDDPDGAVANMFSLRDTSAMPMSPAFDMESVSVVVCEVLGTPVGAG
jgi:hypothetical protein